MPPSCAGSTRRSPPAKRARYLHDVQPHAAAKCPMVWKCQTPSSTMRSVSVRPIPPNEIVDLLRLPVLHGVIDRLLRDAVEMHRGGVIQRDRDARRVETALRRRSGASPKWPILRALRRGRLLPFSPAPNRARDCAFARPRPAKASPVHPRLSASAVRFNLCRDRLSTTPPRNRCRRDIDKGHRANPDRCGAARVR